MAKSNFLGSQDAGQPQIVYVRGGSNLGTILGGLALVLVIGYIIVSSGLVGFVPNAQPATQARASALPVAPGSSQVIIYATAAPIPGLAQNAATTQAQFDAAVAAGNQNAQPAAQAQPQAPVAQQPVLPTAVILIPTAIPVEQVKVVPVAYPQTYTSNEPPTITPVPTIAYPTPLPAAIASNYTVSPDGKCVVAPRGGTQYQVCQDWKYQPAEAASVADYIRTGLLPGTEVR